LTTFFHKIDFVGTYSVLLATLQLTDYFFILILAEYMVGIFSSIYTIDNNIIVYSLNASALETQTCCYKHWSMRALLSGKKRDRIKMLTQCAEFPQFAVDHFFRLSDLMSRNHSPSKRNYVESATSR